MSHEAMFVEALLSFHTWMDEDDVEEYMSPWFYGGAETAAARVESVALVARPRSV